LGKMREEKFIFWKLKSATVLDDGLAESLGKNIKSRLFHAGSFFVEKMTLPKFMGFGIGI